MQASDFRIGEQVTVNLVVPRRYDQRGGRWWDAPSARIEGTVYGRRRLSLDIETGDGAVISVTFWEIES